MLINSSQIVIQDNEPNNLDNTEINESQEVLLKPITSDEYVQSQKILDVTSGA